MTSSLRVFSKSESHCVAVWRHVMLLTYRGEVSLEALESTRAAFLATKASHGDGIGCLTVTEHARASDGVVSEAATLARASFPYVKWSVCVLSTPDGFIASAARSALTSVLNLAGQRLRIHVCSTLAEAAAWQAGRPGGVLADSLLSVYGRSLNGPRTSKDVA